MTLRHSAAVLASLALLVTGCAQGGNEIDLRIDEELLPDALGTDLTPDGIPDVFAVAAQGLRAPSAMDFLPDGRAVVIERDTGRVLLVDHPATAPEGGEPVVAGTVPGIRARAESGLLGVAVSPTFEDDQLIFLYLSRRDENVVARARLVDDELGDLEDVLGGIPVADRNNGGALHFAEDGTLLVGTGDAERPSLAQRRGNLAGKVLRITTDGEAPEDNPFDGQVVWSLGHRDVTGLTTDADGNLWASEPGRRTADEINLIEPGSNYGWPRWEGPIEADPNAPGPDDPVEPARTLDPRVSTWSGIAFSGGYLWLAALQGERLWRIKIDDTEATDATDYLVQEYGRLRLVALGPDGRLWLGTSNHDGSGEPGPGDDQLLVINP